MRSETLCDALQEMERYQTDPVVAPAMRAWKSGSTESRERCVGHRGDQLTDASQPHLVRQHPFHGFGRSFLL